MDKEKEVFFNRAEVQSAEQMNCENCFEQVIFRLRDNEHEFSLGLMDVLRCLKFAEEQGEIPRLPNDWWCAVISRFML